LAPIQTAQPRNTPFPSFAPLRNGRLRFFSQVPRRHLRTAVLMCAVSLASRQVCNISLLDPPLSPKHVPNPKVLTFPWDSRPLPAPSALTETFPPLLGSQTEVPATLPKSVFFRSPPLARDSCLRRADHPGQIAPVTSVSLPCISTSKPEGVIWLLFFFVKCPPLRGESTI